jgi:3-oxoacyl-[acyl-carrier-protein] synthase III
LNDIYLDALGVYLPEQVDARTAIKANLYEEELRAESGLEGTHISKGTPALDMAVLAGRQALARGTIKPDEIDYVAHGANYYQGPTGWTSTGYLMRNIGLADAPSVQVNQECNGLMAALEIAIGQLTGAASRTSALLTTASNYETPLIDRWRGFGPQAIAGDGGAALTVTTKGGFAEVLSLNSATLPSAEGWLRGTESLLPPAELGGWALNPVQRAIEYAGATEESVQDWLDSASAQCRSLCMKSVAEAKIDVSDLARVIGFHLARYAVEEQVAGLVGVPLERTNWEFGRSMGHLGPCDHVVSLDLLLRNGQLAAGDHVLLISWGGGWNTTATVLRILHIPDWARAA